MNHIEVSTQRLILESSQLEYHYQDRRGTMQADPIVMLHPWFGCWQFWQYTLASLHEYECYALDLYSLGSGGGQQFASPEGLGRATIAHLDAAGIETCTLIGNSMGGIVGQVVASSVPSRVRSLVLVGTGASTSGTRPAFRESLWSWVRSPPDRNKTAGMVASLMARRPAPTEFENYVDEVMKANKEFMGNVLAEAYELDLRPRLRSITARTLVVRGELDAARTPDHVRELLTGIADSEAVEMPGAGHSPMVDSGPQFVEVLRRFLEQEEC
jgi:3-oxoadipate enol-lactonase